MRSRFGDYETDWLIPIGIMALVGSLASFFIAVRSVLGFGDESVLSYVCFWLILGSIGISLLRYRVAGPMVAGPYAFGLALALWLFLTAYTYQYGGLVSGRSGSFEALFSNYALGALIWFSSHWLTKNCTVDEEEAAKGQEGVFDSLFRLRGRQREAPLRPRKHVGRSVMAFSVMALVLFGIGQKFIPPDAQEAHRRAFWSMVVYAFFALFLLSLTNLSSLRIYLARRKIRLPAVMTPIWIGVTVPLILIILLVAGALPRRDVVGVTPRGGAAQRVVSSLRPWPWGLRESGRETGKRRTQGQKASGRAGERKGGKGPGERADSGAATRRQGRGREGAGEGSEMASRPERPMQMPQAPAPQVPWGLLALIGLAILLLLALAVLARLIAKHFPRGLLSRFRRRRREQEDEFEVDIWANPFADPRLSPAQVVDHVYRVLLSYGRLMGKPRRPWQTPYEYFRALSPAMADVQPAARLVTQLYVRAAYTPGSVEASCLPEVERIWRDLQTRIAQLMAAAKQEQPQRVPA